MKGYQQRYNPEATAIIIAMLVLMYVVDALLGILLYVVGLPKPEWTLIPVIFVSLGGGFVVGPYVLKLAQRIVSSKD